MRRKVLIVSHASPRYSKAGAQLAAYREHTVLRRCGVDSLFAGAMAEPEHSRAPTVEVIAADEIAYRFREYNDRYQIWRDTRGMSEFLDFVAAHKPDVVHLHHYWRIGLNTIVALRRRLPRARFVLTFHEMLSICINHGQMVKSAGGLCVRYDRVDCHICFGGRTVQDVERRRFAHISVFDLMDAYVYPSEFIRSRYEAWGLSSEKGHTVENILELSDLNSDGSGEDEDGGAEVRKFAFFGALTRFKGLDVLIKATAVAKKLTSDIVVYVYGATRAKTEEMFPELKPAIEQLDDALCFMGAYEPSAVIGLMRRCDWMVMPSIWWENSPMVIQEALAARLPTIVSNIGGMAEKIRDGADGIHFQVGDHRDLAEKIARVATRSLSLQLKKTMARPISEDRFLLGIETAFGFPLNREAHQFARRDSIPEQAWLS